MLPFFRKLFYPIFFILFILSFFLIEGDSKFYLFGAWSIFIVIYGHLLIEKKHFLPKSVFLTFIVTASFLTTTFFSTHIPLSIEKLLLYFFALEIFVFFRMSSERFINYKLFLYCLSISALILNVLVIFLTFFNFEQISFPSMNLLVRTYGHNHYVAFLLLMIPIFWWQLIFSQEERWLDKKDIKIMSIASLVLSYFIVLISLARLSLIVVLLQLILIFLINKEEFFRFSKNKIVFGLTKISIIVFLLITVVYLLLTLSVWNNNMSCSLNFIKKQPCQSLVENIRFSYWQTSLTIFKENLIFGSGLKTFGYISRHLPSDGLQFTSYAHNVFLHNLAETGIVGGGSFIIFIIYLYYKSFIKIRFTKNYLYKFLWIASFSSLLNAIFDYDWDFFIIFSLTLIFLAIILKNDNEKMLNKVFNINIYFIILFLIGSFFSSVFIGTKLLLINNRQELIIKNFPYFNHQITYLINQPNFLTIKDYEKLWFLYKNDPNYILKYLDMKNITYEKKIELIMQLANLDHVSFLSYYSRYFSHIDNTEHAVELAKIKISIIKKRNFLSDHEILTYTLKKRELDATEFVSLAEKLYKEKKYEMSAYFYNKAHEFYPEIYTNKKLFFEYDEDVQAISQMLLHLELQTDDFGFYGYDYDIQFANAISEAWKNNDLNLAIALTERLPKNYRYNQLIFKNIINITHSSQKTDLETKKYNLNLYFNEFKEKEEWSLFDLSSVIVNE